MKCFVANGTMTLTLTDYIQRVRAGTLDPKTVTDTYIKKIAGDTTNSFLRVHQQYVDDMIADCIQRPLAAAPI